MHWSDVWFIAIGCFIVGMVLKSMFRHWQTPSELSPLEGWYKSTEKWLEGNGYQVLRRKQRAKWRGYLDTQEYEHALTADFIVRKDGKTYAVEVGAWNNELLSEDQLKSNWYPIYSAFGVEGILFVDVDHEAVHTVDFEVTSPSYVVWKRVFNRGLWLVSGVIVTFAWLHGR